jgi:hypothetical protein
MQPNQPTRRLLVPDIAWIEIPAGPFIYGEGRKQTKLHLDDFWMAKYPITVTFIAKWHGIFSAIWHG